MRKIIVFNMVTLDGMFAGPNGEIDWHKTDEEFNEFAVEQTKSFYGIIFGRITYQMFEDYWPKATIDPKMSEDDKEIGRSIGKVEKIVFSKTLSTVTEKENWKNIKLFKEIVPNEINKLKSEAGGDLVIFGSGTIVQEMTNLGLIDEYRLMVNPVILGKGKPIFANVMKKIELKLINTRTFKNGNILLSYQNLS
jgi:dihydrofolate reductase